MAAAATIALTTPTALTGCSSHTQAHTTPRDNPNTAIISQSLSGVIVLDDNEPDQAARSAVNKLTSHAPVVVIADFTNDNNTEHAATIASQLNLPVLPDTPETAETLNALGTTTVLVMNNATAPTRQNVIPVHHDTSPADLRAYQADPKPTDTIVATSDSVAGQAISASGRAVGAATVTCPDGDTSRCADFVTLMSSYRNAPLVAYELTTDTTSSWAKQLSLARNGIQLPGGGQRIFTQTRVVATNVDLFGDAHTRQRIPPTPQQVSSDLAKITANLSQPGRHTVGAFDITIQQTSGTKKQPTDASTLDIATLAPWVDEAARRGFFIFLTIQPIDDDYVSTFTPFVDLIARPNVGVAIDPRWSTSTGTPPKTGTVPAASLNKLARWLTEIADEKQLPQKAVIIRQYMSRTIDKPANLINESPAIVFISSIESKKTNKRRATLKALHRKANKDLRYGWAITAGDDDLTSDTLESLTKPSIDLVTIRNPATFPSSD